MLNGDKFVSKARVLCLAMLLLATTACGARAVGSQSIESGYSRATTGGEQVDPATWKNPVGPGAQSLGSLDDAKLPFVPRVPAVSQVPENVVASTASSADDLREIGWAYEDLAIGKFMVVEAPVDYTQSALLVDAGLPAGCSDPTPVDEKDFGSGATSTACHSAGFNSASLEGGEPALLILGATVTSVTWLEPLEQTDPGAFSGYLHPSLEIRVMGPADELTAEEALGIANKI